MAKQREHAETIGYRRLWRDWLSPYKWLILLALVLMVVNAIASAGYSKAIQLIINAYESADTSVIYWGPLAIILISSAKGFSVYWQSLASNHTFGDFERQLRKRLYNRLLFADLARLQSDSPASLATRLTADVGMIRGAVQAMMSGFSSIAIIIATSIVMLTIDWSITIVLLLVFALAILPVNMIGTKVRKITERSQAQLSQMNNDVVEGLSGIRMARTYQLEKHLGDTADSIFDDLFGLNLRIQKWQARLSPVMEILSGFAIAALLVFVSWKISRGTINVADFMGLLTGVGVISQPAKRLGNTLTVAMQGMVAMERVFDILDADNDIHDVANAKTVKRSKGHLQFKNVGFSYSNGFKALNGVDFDVPAGKKIALVGRSGAGKSTIFSLIPRLFEATEGQITLDGDDIRSLTLESLRAQIALVGQESVLMAGTIAENIGFGRMDASDADIRAAAKAAAADGFIQKLDDGYDTVLTPSGGHFSGGEKQRISIARAILRDAPILLLDEPTSALDAESESAIRTALAELSKGRTTLIIAHRLSTILDSDVIIVMDDGRVVESGSHDELLSSNGLYAELYRLQFANT